ncbi:MAG: LysR family transcriptional regulator [Polyangiaceae bacterium]
MNRFHLDLNDIAIFASVVEAENLTRAAKSLGLPKSTVSRKLAALEHRLGVRLLHRTPRRIDVTDAGRTLHREARDALAQLATAADRVGGSKDGMRGKVRVSAPVDLSIAICGPILSAFSAEHPEITVEVEFSDRKVDLTQEGFDFAVRVGDVVDTALVARQVGVIRGHLVASPEYVARHGALSRVEDASKHRFIQFAPTGRFLDTMSLIGPDGARIQIPFVGHLRLNSLLVARDAVLAGVGIARLPTYISGPHVGAGRLVHLLPGYWTEQRIVRVVHMGRKLLPGRVSMLLDFLAERMEVALRC